MYMPETSGCCYFIDHGTCLCYIVSCYLTVPALETILTLLGLGAFLTSSPSFYDETTTIESHNLYLYRSFG